MKWPFLRLTHFWWIVACLLQNNTTPACTNVMFVPYLSTPLLLLLCSIQMSQTCVKLPNVCLDCWTLNSTGIHLCSVSKKQHSVWPPWYSSFWDWQCEMISLNRWESTHYLLSFVNKHSEKMLSIAFTTCLFITVSRTVMSGCVLPRQKHSKIRLLSVILYKIYKHLCHNFFLY